jgi:acetyl esterase/lipase
MPRRLIAACSVVLLLATALFLLPGAGRPQQEAPPVEFVRDVVFGTGGNQELKLDLARPGGDGPFPAVLCLHGGGWVEGDRRELEQTLNVLAKHGYVAVSPDYRLAPNNPFPAAVEDCKAAVRWLRANATREKVDPDHIGVMGFAAGGHLACLVGVTKKSDGLEGKGGNADVSSRVQAVVCFCGPTDLTLDNWDEVAKKENLIPFLGGSLEQCPEAYRKASPIMYVLREAPPFLFVHGSEDKMVPPSHSEVMAQWLCKATGRSVRVVTLEGEGHALRGEKLRKGVAEMMAFFAEQLKGQGR